jgi:hypothetical protein
VGDESALHECALQTLIELIKDILKVSEGNASGKFRREALMKTLLLRKAHPLFKAFLRRFKTSTFVRCFYVLLSHSCVLCTAFEVGFNSAELLILLYTV